MLIVEDERAIADVVAAYLHRDGIRSHHSGDGLEALRLFQRLQPDLVLLDIRLPGMDGIDVLRNIRAESNTPVIMLTAFVDDVDKLLALRLGADDYIVKPFVPAEVVARAQAVLRRTGLAKKVPSLTEKIRAGAIEIDPVAHTASVHEGQGRPRQLQLTLTEFRLLTCLAGQPQRCFTRAELIETCLPESDALDRVIDSHLSKLRKKLQQAGQVDLIETVRGIGYRLWPGS